MTIRCRLVIPALLLISTFARAGEKVQEFRHHCTVRNTDGTSLYEVTEIVQLAETRDSNILLVRDPDHGSFLMERNSTYTDHTVRYSISDVKRQSFVRSSFRTPFTARTREGTVAEAEGNEKLVSTPVFVTITTNGGEWSIVSTDLDEWARVRQLRHEIRPTMDFFLLEAIERMRGAVFAIPGGDIFFMQVAQYVVYDTRDAPRLAVQQENQPPACDFDKSFGYPCSAAQLEKIRKRAEEGKPLDRY